MSSDLACYNYGARMYDPTMGRWNGVDALAELDMNFSPYTFVGNNPLIYMDPTGMKRKKIDDETYEETEHFDEVVVKGKKPAWAKAAAAVGGAVGLVGDFFYGNRRSMFEMALAVDRTTESYQRVHKGFVEGGNVAAVVAVAPLALTEGVALLAEMGVSSGGRWLLRKLNYGAAFGDFGTQMAFYNGNIAKVNFLSVGSQLFGSGFSTIGIKAYVSSTYNLTWEKGYSRKFNFSPLRVSVRDSEK